MILADGKLVLDAAPLLAVRDALMRGDADEAYHQLLMAADPDLKTHAIFGNHWHDWEFAAAKSAATVIVS